MAFLQGASGASERLQLPDVRRLERMPSLPEWVASRIALITDECQRSREGKWCSVPTLPSHTPLSPTERREIEEHVAALDLLCAQTALASEDCERALLVLLTKLMMVLPSTTQNELSAE